MNKQKSRKNVSGSCLLISDKQQKNLLVRYIRNNWIIKVIYTKINMRKITIKVYLIPEFLDRQQSDLRQQRKLDLAHIILISFIKIRTESPIIRKLMSKTLFTERGNKNKIIKKRQDQGTIKYKLPRS